MRMNAARQQRIGGRTTLRARLIPNERRLPSDGNVADGGAMLLNHAERGAWIESALGVVEQHGTAVGDTAVAWEPPLIWDQPRAESGLSAVPLLPGSIQERCTPRGSRHHIFEHTSPGGTLRVEQYTSPAGGRVSGAERCAWRYRIAKSRREARREARGLVAPYSMQCTVCRRELHIIARWAHGSSFPQRDYSRRGERALQD